MSSTKTVPSSMDQDDGWFFSKKIDKRPRESCESLLKTGSYRLRRLSDTKEAEKPQSGKVYVMWSDQPDESSTPKRQKVGSITVEQLFFDLHAEFSQLKNKTAALENKTAALETETSQLQGELKNTNTRLNKVLVSNPELYDKLNTNRHLSAVAVMEYSFDRVTFHLRRILAGKITSGDLNKGAKKWFGPGKVFWEGDLADVSWRRAMYWSMLACRVCSGTEGEPAQGKRLGDKDRVEFKFFAWDGKSVPEAGFQLSETVQKMIEHVKKFRQDEFHLVRGTQILKPKSKLQAYHFTTSRETILIRAGSFTREAYWQKMGYTGPILSTSWTIPEKTKSPVSDELLQLMKDAEMSFAAEIGLQSSEDVHRFLGTHLTALMDIRNEEVHFFGLHPWRKGSKAKLVNEARIGDERRAYYESFQKDELVTSFSLMDLKMKALVLDDISSNISTLHSFYTEFSSEFLLLIDLVRRKLSEITALCVYTALKKPSPVIFRSGVKLTKMPEMPGMQEPRFEWSPSNGWEILLRGIEKDSDIFNEVNS